MSSVKKGFQNFLIESKNNEWFMGISNSKVSFLSLSKKEKKAEKLYRDIQKALKRSKRRKAQSLFRELKEKYADTQFYSSHNSRIEELFEKKKDRDRDSKKSSKEMRKIKQVLAKKIHGNFTLVPAL